MQILRTSVRSVRGDFLQIIGVDSLIEVLQDEAPKPWFFRKFTKTTQRVPAIYEISRNRFAHSLGWPPIITLTVVFVPVVNPVP